MGSAKITGQTDDFHQLDQETEQRRVAFDKVYQAAALVLKQLDKKKPSPEDGKTKVSPTEALGACWVNHGSVFPDDSLLGMLQTFLNSVLLWRRNLKANERLITTPQALPL